jgi:serine/threonine protein kinase HipA of HipAB toxin-antitoxin module
LSDEEVARIVSDLTRNPLGVGDDQEFRISLAGAQEKTALLYWDGKWQVPHGTTATTHILKPQIGRLPNGIDLSNSVENEHNQIVQELGDTAKQKIDETLSKLPPDFSAAVAQSISEGAKRRIGALAAA